MECHDTETAEAKHEHDVAAGKSLVQKHVHKVPAERAIALGMQKMGDKERESVKKVMDVACFIALKGRPFANFQDHIELQKLHEVNFDTNSCENEIACQEFIKTILYYLFDEDVQKKLTRVNSIAILIVSKTDRAAKEQVVLYEMSVDPDTHKPTAAYFGVLEIDDSGQTARRGC